ncbi:MAG: tRNA nucleotidyltransferase/poly(A) polymerase [Nitrospirae bacterium]|nr:MAG: tRNA nucleotidyltransferase/poly(A) polymerase [Nitrospirota bacterium]
MHALLHSFITFAHEKGILRECYLVGGAVRDILLNRPTSDYDIAVQHNAKVRAQEFAEGIGGKCIVLDARFGAMRVTKDRDYIDICRMQGDTIAEDLGTRDLTINAMALPLGSLAAPDPAKQLIDPFNGSHDLQCKTIRMVSEQNLLNDPLRMLRVFRFAQSLHFTPEVQTLNVIRQQGARIAESAVERIAEELRHILREPQSYRTMKLIQRDGFADHIFPELAAATKVQQQKQLQAYGYLEHILNNLPLYFFEHAQKIDSFFAEPHRAVSMKLALLFPTPAAAESCARRLRLSRHEIEGIAMIEHHLADFSELMGAENRDRLRFLHMVKDTIYTLIIFAVCQECICRMADSPTLFYCREMLTLYHADYQERLKLLPLLTGNDLISELRLKPSPLFKTILNAVELSVIEGSLQGRLEAVEAAREMTRTD